MSKITHASLTTSALGELGIGENEAFLYEIILKLKEPTIQDLQNNSPFSRTMLYYVLKNLMELKLLSTGKKGKKTFYIPEHPQNLLDIAEQKERNLERGKHLIQEILPQLSSLYKLGQGRPGIQFFEGLEGYKEALYSTLDAKETIYAYNYVTSLPKEILDLDVEFVKERIKRGVKKNILTAKTPEMKKLFEKENTVYNENKGLTEVRHLKKTLKPFGLSMHIYDNKIAYFPQRKDHLIAIIIEDPDIYLMHRQWFEMVWDNLDEWEGISA